MGSRSCVVSVLALLSLPAGQQCAHAQDAGAGVQATPSQASPHTRALPAIVVSRAPPSVKPTRPRAAARTLRPLPTPAQEPAPPQRLVVYPTTPVSSSGIDIEKVPASVNIVDVNQIERTRSAS